MTRILKKSKELHHTFEKIPLDFHIEIMPKGRGYKVLVSGVRSVKSFSFECILVRLKRRTLKIVGERLEIASLEDSVVQISGDIKEFELLYDKF